MRIRTRKGALEGDAVTGRDAAAERHDRERRGGWIAGSPGEEGRARTVGDERRLVLGDRLERRRRRGCEIGSERLVHRRRVGIRVREESDLREPARVDRDRLVVAAAARVHVADALTVQPCEDVDESRSVLREVRRPVGCDCAAVHRSGCMRLRLNRPGPRLPIVARGQPSDTLRVREVQLQRAVGLLQELRPPRNRVARDEHLRRAAVARELNRPVRRVEGREERSRRGDDERRDRGDAHARPECRPRTRSRGEHQCGERDGSQAHASMVVVGSSGGNQGNFARMVAMRIWPAAAAILVLAGCGGHRHATVTTHATTTTKAVVRVHRARAVRLAPTAAGVLPAPLQDAAAAPYAGGAVLIGGLTASDVSSDQIVVATRAGARTVGRLPVAFHDSAAVTLGRLAYAFGGGDGVRQLDAIERVDPHTGAVEQVGTLPAPSSDQAGAALNGTAYIVGGYTGTHWLDTIVAWRPGKRAQ